MDVVVRDKVREPSPITFGTRSFALVHWPTNWGLVNPDSHHERISSLNTSYTYRTLTHIAQSAGCNVASH